MTRSTDFDDKYMVVDSQRYIVCTVYSLRELSEFMSDKNASDYTMIVRHFDVDKCGMIVKEYNSQGNILDENFLSHFDYGNAIWEML